MRAYFFGNMYLSSIQQGIQAAHATAEMFAKYMVTSTNQFSMLHEWAMNHKVMVLLNAGYSEEIHKLIEMFLSEENPFPWAPFFEGKDALDGALTTVGIILPEEIYTAAKDIREGKSLITIDPHRGTCLSGFPNLTVWQLQLAQQLNNYGLAK